MGQLFADLSWMGILAGVWLFLLAATAAYLGYRLLQARRRAPSREDAEAERAIKALERGAQRMPLLEFIKRAGRQGWDVSGRSIEIMELMQGLRHACGVDQVRAWGRPIRADVDVLRTELHQPIPSVHWRAFEFDIDTIIAKQDNFDTRSCNLKQSQRHGGGFLDIYVDGQAALDWLEGDAEKLKKARN